MLTECWVTAAPTALAGPRAVFTHSTNPWANIYPFKL